MNNWPIRVGGEYAPVRNASESWLGCRVTAIDEDEIHYVLRTKHYGGEIAEHTPTSASADLFRDCYCPEDQSPLPTLIEALKRIEAATEGIPAYVRTNDENWILDTAQAALAAVSEHPSNAVAEEVTA